MHFGGYSNLILDFGGVLINIRYQTTAEAFERLGIADFSAWFSQQAQSPLFDDLEIGRVSETEFAEAIRASSGLQHLSDAHIIEAWNAMLLEVPEERYRLLERLKTKHRLFLLSNTNSIHQNAFSEQIDRQYGWKKFTDLFDGVYLSHEVGLRKPHVEVFERVIADHALVKNETLFIDDSVQHLEGARGAGIVAHWLEPGQDILDLF